MPPNKHEPLQKGIKDYFTEIKYAFKDKFKFKEILLKIPFPNCYIDLNKGIVDTYNIAAILSY